MKFGPFREDPQASAPGARTTPRGGIPGRVESAMKTHVPAPKGKGIVMMLLGLAVVGALIWDFSGRGAARRAVKRSMDDGARPVPKEAPPHVERPAVPVAPDRPGRDLQLPIRTPAGELTLTPGAAAALMASAPEAEREQMRLQILKALVKPSGARGALRREALEAAAWFLEGDAAQAAGVVSQLTLRAHAALGDDGAAHAATLFLARLPDRGGALAAAALDEVILDPKRPLHVRIAAARARGRGGDEAALAELARDPGTHPALREALPRP